MINRKQKFFIAVLAAAVCAIQSPAQTNTATPSAPASMPADTTNAPDKMTALFGDPVIAKGKGVEVKQSQLDAEMSGLRAKIAASGRNIPPEYEDQLERGELDRLINLQLLLSTATDADRAEGQATTDKQMDQMIKQVGSEDALERRWSSLGLTAAQAKKELTEQNTAQARVTRELGIKVSDDDAKKFYDEHPAEFEQPEMVRAAHILLMTSDPATGQPLSQAEKDAKRKQIDDLLKRAKAGEDFGAMAKKYSEDPGSKDTGGEYTFPRGQMVPEFEAAAFSLQTNQISDVVTTQFGYHIIKLYEKIPAQKQPLDKVEPRIKEVLEERAVMKQLPDLAARLNKAAGVQILDERLKNVVLPPPVDNSADEPEKTDEGSKPAAPSGSSN